MKAKDLKKDNEYLLNNINRFEFTNNKKVIFKGKANITENMPLNRIYSFKYSETNQNDMSLSNIIYLNESEVNDLIDCNNKQIVYCIYNLNERLTFYTNKDYAEYIYNERYYMDKNISIKQETINTNN